MHPCDTWGKFGQTETETADGIRKSAAMQNLHLVHGNFQFSPEKGKVNLSRGDFMIISTSLPVF